jgi:hypothetical protein
MFWAGLFNADFGLEDMTETEVTDPLPRTVTAVPPEAVLDDGDEVFHYDPSTSEEIESDLSSSSDNERIEPRRR